jgi:hypothetical protein
MYCQESEFKSSSYGRNKIFLIKKNYSSPLRPITDNYFLTSFLKPYYLQNNSSPDESFLNCYERLLDYWAKDRATALNAEYDLGQGNKAYEAWVRNYNPFGDLGKLLTSIPFLVGAALVIGLINMSKK